MKPKKNERTQNKSAVSNSAGDPTHSSKRQRGEEETPKQAKISERIKKPGERRMKFTNTAKPSKECKQTFSAYNNEGHRLANGRTK